MLAGAADGRRRDAHRSDGGGTRGGSTAELAVVAGGCRVFGFITGRGVVHADGGVGRLFRAGAHMPEQPFMACVEVAHDRLRCRIGGAGGHRCGVVEIGAQQRAGEVDELARAAEAVGCRRSEQPWLQLSPVRTGGRVGNLRREQPRLDQGRGDGGAGVGSGGSSATGVDGFVLLGFAVPVPRIVSARQL